MGCMFHLERDVNEVLWNSVFDESRPYGRDGNGFENDVFEVRPYDWSEKNNDYHFYHKPSGLKICWYKYPLRSPMSNMKITHEQFLTVLRDCFNSLHKNVKYQIEPWWVNKDVKTDETSQLNAKDIKKALECCRDASHNPAFCKECPYDKKENCSIALANDALALMDYYEEEIEWLKTEDNIRIEQILDKVRYLCGADNKDDKQIYVITKDELNILERRLKGED